MIDVTRTPLGRIAVARKALARLVRDAAEGVDGARVVRPRRTLQVTVAEDGSASVELALSAPHGAVLPELGRRVQERVAEVLCAALDVTIAHVDVTIEEIGLPGGKG
jgi:uncharacterized alkaline shock family protein YloU